MMRKSAFSLILATCVAGPLAAQEVGITDTMSKATFTINGQTFTIERNQDQSAQLSGEFTKTSRACPPFCIHPMEAAPGVETVGELEVLDFLKTDVASGKGLLIDARLPDFYANSTIPGAVNVPFSTLDSANPYLGDILQALGAAPIGGGFDFSGAVDLMVFCNGPWCDQGPRANRHLVSAGYPAAKLHYYRGGMQDWLILGLTTIQPASNG